MTHQAHSIQHAEAMSRLLPRLLLALAALLAPAMLVSAATWGDPRGFFDNEECVRQELQSGLIWWSANGERNSQPLRVNLILVDLSNPEIDLRTLTGDRFVNLDSGQYFRRSTVSQLLEDNDALAAINVSFFDIGATQAPDGLTIQNGRILREPSGRTNFIALPEGRAAIGNFGWEAEVSVGSEKRPLNGVNRPALAPKEIVLYRAPWTKSPGNSAAFTRGQSVRELVLQEEQFFPAPETSASARIEATVTAIRDSLSGVSIKNSTLVLTAGTEAAPWFDRLRPGDSLEIGWRLTGGPKGLPTHAIQHIVSSGPVLVRDGAALHGTGALWTARHPRSAAGISEDGRHVLFLLVDGRSKESVGINLDDLAAFLVHLGAHHAVNFDGGGSSALAAQVRGKARLLNQPSGGTERYVPTGLGVAAAPENSLSRPRAWTGQNGRVMKGVFDSYDAQSGLVTLILNGRRFTFPITSLSPADQALVLRASPTRN